MKLTTMLLFTVAAQAGVTRNQARGNLLASCHNIALGPSESGRYHLQANCGPEDELVDFVLEECVANDNGVLVWQKEYVHRWRSKAVTNIKGLECSGNFGESCNYCKVMVNGEGEAPGYFLQCRCKTKSGGATNQDLWSFNLGRWHIS